VFLILEAHSDKTDLTISEHAVDRYTERVLKTKIETSPGKREQIKSYIRSKLLRKWKIKKEDGIFTFKKDYFAVIRNSNVVTIGNKEKQ